VNATEASELVALMALYDNRRASDPDVVAWLKIIGDLDYADCETAILAHYRESRERIMPAHIRERVMEIRHRRLRETEIPPPPPELLDNPHAYRAALRAAAIAIADGRDPEAAMQAIAAQARRPELEAS